MSEKPSTFEKSHQAKGPPAPKAYVVLLVENEVLERVPKVVHLRTAGFDVIEAADGEEARRALDSVPVNVVFADLAMPDQTNGLAFLRWLRKHHPATKAIVTSDTETNMPLEGYGMFLSKPYRLADLDYCLQKVLAPLRIAASETGGATTADPSSKVNPAPGKAQPDGVSPNRPPARDEADGRDDDVSRPSIAELSRRLGERAARLRALDPAAAKAARRAAQMAYDRTRTRRQRLVLGFAVGAIACSAVAYLVPTIRLVAVPLSPSTAASTAALAEPVAFLSVAAATPTPAPADPASPPSAPSSPSPATDVAYTPAVVPASAQTVPAAGSQQAGEPDPAAARRNEGSPGETAVLWLQSGAGRRSPGGHDGRRRHGLPAEQGPTANRQGRPRTAGAAPPGSCAHGCPARHGPLRPPEPFARTAPLRSVRTRAGRGRSPRPMAGLTATLRRRIRLRISATRTLESSNGHPMVRRRKLSQGLA